MAININHSTGKISSDSDLKLDAGVGDNIDVSTKIVKNASDPVDNQDLVTKIYLDNALSGATGQANLLLGTPPDGQFTDGAYQGFDSTQTLTEAIDDLNEVIENVRNDTFVRTVDFTADQTVGGAGLTTTLTIVTEGNANRYTIDWGDGDVTTATSDSTPTHTYADNSGSPYDVEVTAFNNQGNGSGSTISKLREDYITIFTADPAVSFVAYDALTGGNAITSWDDGDTVYFENTTTNTSGATIQYTWEWGDGSSDDVITDDTVAGGADGVRIPHTFTTSTEQEVTRQVTLTLDSHSTATPGIVPLDDDTSFKIYDTHTPDVSSDITTGINEESNNGLTVTFTNNTENTIGSYSQYGIRYIWTFGDGDTETVNVGSNQDGDTGNTITHKYTLPGNNTATDYTGNLQVVSQHSSSPFFSSDFVIHVEPDVRASINGSADTVSDRNGDNQYDVYDGVDYNGVNRALVTVNNTTQHGDTFDWDWNDGSSNDATSDLSSVSHDFTGVAPGNYQLVMTATGTPDITTQTDTDSLTFQVHAVPSAPDGLSSKTIQLTDAAQGYSPALAHGFTDNSATSPLSAGDSLATNTARRYTNGTIDTSVAQNVYNGLSGTATAIVNGSADGSKAFTTALNENGTFDSLVISDQRDANDSISGTTYPSDFYQTFDAKITKPFSEYTTGVNDQRIEHSETGNTNYVTVVSDDNTAVPTIDTSSATMTESNSGTYRYISGIPYYNSGNPEITVSGITISDWIGQAYRDTTSVLEIQNGTNYESTSGATINTQYKTYAELEDTPYLTSGIPNANTLNYSFADQTVDITNSNVAAVEDIKVRAYNVNGTSNFESLPTKLQVHTSNPFGILELSIPVESSLGNGVITSSGTRIADFVNDSTDTPTINSSTNYTATPFTGAIAVSGTQEATIRWGKIIHDTSDYSTGYLPVGPDRSADTGTQYFTFAFQRQVVANFGIDITATGIEGLWIAAPGTAIDSASGLNGWIDCTVQYAGVGVPGSDTANGGNGSDGCAFTGADVVPTGTSLNKTYTMTLGSENMSNATNNVVLVRVAISSGQEITSIDVEDVS